ncbi:MAG: hypothetical protein KF712_04570 [Akkermansiaceae bacterium]|nr:hypothetical protein [Akkermansiaceae bacterium]
MWRLHLFPALLATSITGGVCAILLFGKMIAARTAHGFGLPNAVDLGWFLADLPKVLSSFAVLHALLAAAMALLWKHAPSVRLLSRPWMSAVCGGFLGIILSPGMYMAYLIIHRELRHLAVDDYLNFIDYLGFFATITGALYFFLHSFFIRQALAKKAWLAERV